MRILSRKTLRAFWESPGRRDAEQPLKSWFREASRADWKSPMHVKQDFGNASIIANCRAVFNIGGNKYRLIVQINYAYGIVYVRFIGTHHEYDQVNAQEV